MAAATKNTKKTYKFVATIQSQDPLETRDIASTFDSKEVATTATAKYETQRLAVRDRLLQKVRDLVIKTRKLVTGYYRVETPTGNYVISVSCPSPKLTLKTTPPVIAAAQAVDPEIKLKSILTIESGLTIDYKFLVEHRVKGRVTEALRALENELKQEGVLEPAETFFQEYHKVDLAEGLMDRMIEKATPEQLNIFLQTIGNPIQVALIDKAE